MREIPAGYAEGLARGRAPDPVPETLRAYRAAAASADRAAEAGLFETDGPVVWVELGAHGRSFLVDWCRGSYDAEYIELLDSDGGLAAACAAGAAA